LYIGLLGVLAAGGVWWVASAFLSGLWYEALAWIIAKQNTLHRELARAIRLVAQQGSASAWSLIGLSFVYGIFHAAGPGHGKAVIATYLGTSRIQWQRGLLLSLLSALMQGLVAILLVELLVGLLGYSLRRAQGAALQLETLSFALIALLGLLLAVRSLLALIHRWQTPPSASLFSGQAGSGSSPFAARLPGSSIANNRHSGVGKLKAFCADCGGFFQLKNSLLKQKLTWRSGLPIVLSIGIRPCTGAVLVLLIAHTLGLRWAGMAAVLAMSLGTALTICLLALAVISLRQGLLLRLQRKPRPRLNMVFDGLALAGGVLILMLGIGLLRQTLLVVNHPLL